MVTGGERRGPGGEGGTSHYKGAKGGSKRYQGTKDGPERYQGTKDGPERYQGTKDGPERYQDAEGGAPRFFHGAGTDKHAGLKSWLKWFSLAAAIIVLYKSFDTVADVLKWISGLWSILTPFIIAFVIAYFLDRPVNRLSGLIESSKWEKLGSLKKHSRGISVLAVYLVFIGLLALLGISLVPTLIKGLSSLFGNYQTYIDNAKGFIRDIDAKFPLLGELSIGEQLLEWLGEFVKSINMDTIIGYLESIASLGSTFSSVLVGLIISVYMLLEKKKLFAALRRICSLFMKERTLRSASLWLGRTDRVVFKYFVTQLLDCVIVSVMASIVLAVMGAPSPLALGFVFGMFNIIPYFGPIIGGVIVVLVLLLSKGVSFALWATLALLILQQIDGNIINPRILGESLDLSPFWVIFAVTLGGGLFGFAGMLLSVPVMAVLRMVYRELLRLRSIRLAGSRPVSERSSE